MANTVSVRVKGNSTSKSCNQLAHDMRIKYVNYLKNEAQKNLLVSENEDIIFSQSENNKDKFLELKNLMLKSAEEQKQIHEEAIGQKSQVKNFFVDGIITFSSDMKKDFWDNQDKFKKLAKDTLDDFSKKFGVKLLHHTIHLDEKTPHIHFNFENINRSTGKSVQRYITKLDLKQLQTDVAERWQTMGYKRGKENSKSKHYSVAIGHQKEELENLKNEIQAQKKLIKQQDISSQEKKQELDKLDIVLKQTRIKIKEIKNLSVLDSKIEKDIDNIIKASKGLFKLSEDDLRKNLKAKLKEYSKSDFKSIQERNLEKQVITQRNENNKLIDDYNDLAGAFDNLRRVNKKLKQNSEDLSKLKIKIQDLEEKNQELKSDIKDLEIIYKFNYQEFKENRKSRFTTMRENRNFKQRN